jgi:phosphoenolpyruvate-protein kinase (PTS system EI component)
MVVFPPNGPPPTGGRIIELRAAAEGFAVGRSFRVDSTGGQARIPDRPPRVSLRDAIDRVRSDLQQLTRTLPPAEAELFDPEARILEEIATRLLAREGEGTLRDAVVAETSGGCSDLVIDLRVRLLHVLEGSSPPDLSAAAAHYGDDLVVLTDLITPTMVASLPRDVVAVIGVLDGSTTPRRDIGRNSHAAILARGRGLPLAYASSTALRSIPNGSWLVVEASETGASVRVEPGQASLAAARNRQTEGARDRRESDAGCPSLGHLGVELRVNIASPHEGIPNAADGVGLVRTEMMFAGRSAAPSESEQLAALLLVTAKANGRPVVVRLFDAGGDKPLTWLGGGADASRGVARLLAHPEILATQLRALARARERADVRVLLPFVRTPDEVNAIRRLAGATLRIGAMIESPDAVDAVAAIAFAADFLSIGTNDLTASALGLDRTADAPKSDPHVLSLVHRVITAARACGLTATICGEMVGDEQGARIAVGLGADVLSVAPARLGSIRRTLSRTTMESCRDEATAALGGE